MKGNDAATKTKGVTSSMQTDINKKDYDHLIKIVTAGDSSVGKKSIILRFAEGSFPVTPPHLR